MSQFRNGLLAALLASTTALASLAAHAETISGALAKAYHLNSEMNSARAGTRATDENVPIAKSGYRPTIIGSGAVDYSVTRNRLNLAGNSTTNLFTGSFGVQINQTLFDGFQTRNNVRAAEAQVNASDESLRNTEQNTLFNAASAYMDVIRDRQVAVLARAQPRIPVRAGACRALPLRGRRGYPYRRRPGRSQPLQRRRHAGRGARPAADQRGHLPADRRRGAAFARPRGAARQAVAQEHRFGAVDRRGPASRDPGQPASGRCGRLLGQVQRRRSPAAALGQCRCIAELDQFRSRCHR